MKIGVFDSGVGGKSVANAISRALPQHQVIFMMDSAHFPYATKTPQEIHGYVVPILTDLVGQGCEVIVIACNTVSTNLIDELRETLPVPLIAMEPMVKPAAEQTKSKVIVVCATPTTLASPRYQWLKDTYASGIKVLEPDCSNWSYMIETNQIDRQKIHDQIDQACQAGADMIVLGCTHYHWIEDIITEVVQGRAQVIQPEQPVIEQLKKVMASL
ncbi:MAG: putative Glutamate racemase [Candidatus Saccharibacteria bacterium]|nr:putative Glutamate racemase [Candidatus Saccharibacteria bacterium]